MGTDSLRVDELKAQGYVGAYVDMPEEEYRKLPVVRTPAELKSISPLQP